jgi:hypothetical protein
VTARLQQLPAEPHSHAIIPSGGPADQRYGRQAEILRVADWGLTSGTACNHCTCLTWCRCHQSSHATLLYSVLSLQCGPSPRSSLLTTSSLNTSATRLASPKTRQCLVGGTFRSIETQLCTASPVAPLRRLHHTEHAQLHHNDFHMPLHNPSRKPTVLGHSRQPHAIPVCPCLFGSPGRFAEHRSRFDEHWFT